MTLTLIIIDKETITGLVRAGVPPYYHRIDTGWCTPLLSQDWYGLVYPLTITGLVRAGVAPYH